MTDSEHNRRLTDLLNEIAGADLQMQVPRTMEERVLRSWDAGAAASVPNQKFADIFRAGHPGWLRCFSLTYSRYARSSRLAIRAPRSGKYVTEFLTRNTRTKPIRWNPRTSGWLISGAGALAAAILLLVVVNRSSRGSVAVPATVVHTEVRARPTVPEAPSAPALLAAVAPRPIAIARDEPQRGPRRVDAPGEIVSFMPLFPDAHQDLMGSFQIARVLLPREVLADLGVVLDANRLGGPIQADVVFGEDGLARAIRLAQQGTGRSQ